MSNPDYGYKMVANETSPETTINQNTPIYGYPQTETPLLYKLYAVGTGCLKCTPTYGASAEISHSVAICG
jgi:hypothetical protein